MATFLPDLNRIEVFGLPFVFIHRSVKTATSKSHRMGTIDGLTTGGTFGEIGRNW